jgi:hypothetical protein
MWMGLWLVASLLECLLVTQMVWLSVHPKGSLSELMTVWRSVGS